MSASCQLLGHPVEREGRADEYDSERCADQRCAVSPCNLRPIELQSITFHCHSDTGAF